MRTIYSMIARIRGAAGRAKSAARELAKDRRGTTAILFALTAVPVFVVGGAALDYGTAMRARAAMQAAADAAATAAGTLIGGNETSRRTLATSVFSANLPVWLQGKISPRVSSSLANVSVSAIYNSKNAFLPLLGVNAFELNVLSKVLVDKPVENGSVCMLALNPTTENGIHLQGTTAIVDRNCWAWVDSNHATSINAYGTADATAAGFCTMGNVLGAGHFMPTPLTGCAYQPDPFNSLVQPAVSSCDYNNKQLQKGDWVLTPGVYCGGLTLKPQANVTFMPGIYIIKDGVFEIQGQATAVGVGVMFYFTGEDSNIIVRGGGNIDFKAATSGTYAGFLFMDNRNSDAEHHTIIQGGGRVRMVGILYMPKRVVEIGGNGAVNQEAEYFAMIADSFYLIGNGEFYLKADAAAAGFPDILPKVNTLTRIVQ